METDQGIAQRLRVAQRIAQTGSEGPGTRYALWVQGCSIRCKSCCNPEMFAERGGMELRVEELAAEIVGTEGIEGVTFLGGEPFEQAAGLARLARLVRSERLSIMVFTGYLREDLERDTRPEIAALLEQADLLADGPFIAERPANATRWLGSANQRMHFMTDRYRPEDPRFAPENTVDIRIDRNGKIEISGWAPSAISFVRRDRR